VGLFGPTGSGKDVSSIIPMALTWRGSLTVMDPKNGATMARTMPYRRTFSRIAYFAPYRRESDRINVLESIRWKRTHEFTDASVIAKSHIAPAKYAAATQTGMHFSEMAETMLAASILHVGYTKTQPCMGDVLDFWTSKRELALCLKTLMESPHLGTVPHQIIASMGAEITQVKDRELSGIWSTTMRALHLYRDPLIRINTSTSTVDLATLQTGEWPTTLYLIAESPKTLEAQHQLYRVIFETMGMVTTRQILGSHTYPMLVAFNEFPAFGYMHSIETDIATLREYGWKLFIVAQDLEQLWQTYGPHTTIWGNLHIKLFHTPANDLTAKRISENLLGLRTMRREMINYSRAGWPRRVTSATTHQYVEPLMSTAAVMTMPPERLLVCVTGMPPIMAQKVRFYRERDLRKRVPKEFRGVA
jgi:type IV secretion system protein VirD4